MSQKCGHYDHGVLMRSPCCGVFYPCMRCHDADYDRACRQEFDRHAVTVMRCTACDLEQPAAQACAGCAAVLGTYHCAICAVWDNDMSVDHWHCDKCGLCRKGARADTEHCDTCGVCVIIARHQKCTPGMASAECTVCMQRAISSFVPVLSQPHCKHVLCTPCMESMLCKGFVRCQLCQAMAIPVRFSWKIMLKWRNHLFFKIVVPVLPPGHDLPTDAARVDALTSERKDLMTLAADAIPSLVAMTTFTCLDCRADTRCAWLPSVNMCAACGSGNNDAAPSLPLPPGPVIDHYTELCEHGPLIAQTAIQVEASWWMCRRRGAPPQ
jgi:hypothetical protein